MSDLGRVVVLAGGLSHERDVSLRSGRRVSEALRAVGIDVDERDVGPELVSTLVADPPAAVFPVLHGAAGEDGSVREVLELLHTPYVGSGPAAARVAWDKPTAKTVVAGAGIATPASVTLPEATFRDLGAGAVLDAVLERLGLPLVVKPARGGSALGCTVVHRAEDLPAAMVTCFAYGDTALLERFVTGTEVAVSVVDTGDGPRALPAVEIVPDGGVYDYAARYTAGTTEFFVPARLDPTLADAVEQVAVRAHRALGLRDLSRSDLIVDATGQVQFLEVNVAPGLTETSLLPQAADAVGLELGTLYRDLAALAVSRLAGS
ncbi:MAG TPA: D-alanine--D-alanine ligase [Actinomycetes bacterium]|nr:D-alanine--D-alanine ligase [Actinomycetes bacterium]